MPAADVSMKPSASPKMRKAARAVGQVMAALKNSKSPTGPTMTEIVKFISTSLLEPATKRQVITALKRGVEFGILKRHRGHYQISEPNKPLLKPAKLPVKKIKLPVQKKIKPNEKLEKQPRLVRMRRVRTVPSVHQISGNFPSPPTATTVLENIKIE